MDCGGDEALQSWFHTVSDLRAFISFLSLSHSLSLSLSRLHTIHILTHARAMQGEIRSTIIEVDE